MLPGALIEDQDTLQVPFGTVSLQVTNGFRKTMAPVDQVFLCEVTIYWIAFYCKGKEYRTSAKTTKKREATLLAFYLGEVVRGDFQGIKFERKKMMSLSLTELPRTTLRRTARSRGLAGL